MSSDKQAATFYDGNRGHNHGENVICAPDCPQYPSWWVRLKIWWRHRKYRKFGRLNHQVVMPLKVLETLVWLSIAVIICQITLVAVVLSK